MSNFLELLEAVKEKESSPDPAHNLYTIVEAQAVVFNHADEFGDDCEVANLGDEFYTRVDFDEHVRVVTIDNDQVQDLGYVTGGIVRVYGAQKSVDLYFLDGDESLDETWAAIQAEMANQPGV